MKVHEGFQGAAFGMMDGLITLIGIILGVAEATLDPNLVIIAGVLGGVANSFGNAVGFYASELAERGMQIQFSKKRETMIHTKKEIVVGSVYSFLFSMIALVVPIMPFIYFDNMRFALLVSLMSGMTMLFILGTYVGRLSDHKRPYLYGFKYAFLGLVGGGICFIAGNVLNQYFTQLRH